MTRSAWRRRRRRRRNVAIVTILIGAVALLWPIGHGGHFGVVIVDGHSMEPTLHANDLVLLVRHDSYRVGDLVAFQVSTGTGRGLVVIHRIAARDPDTFTTRGDNNSWNDPWHPRVADVLGLAITDTGVLRMLLATADPSVAVSGLVGFCVAWATFSSFDRSDATRRSTHSSGGSPELGIDDEPAGADQVGMRRVGSRP